jgi:hypothetical protein
MLDRAEQHLAELDQTGLGRARPGHSGPDRTVPDRADPAGVQRSLGTSLLRATRLHHLLYRANGHRSGKRMIAQLTKVFRLRHSCDTSTHKYAVNPTIHKKSDFKPLMNHMVIYRRTVGMLGTWP